MRSPGAAIGWEIFRRHRWGLCAAVGYLSILATYRFLVLDPSQTVSFRDTESFAFAVLVPISITVLYLLAVFAYAPAGDLAGRESPYPSRMFALPLTNTELAGWPMLLGAASMVVLWLATRLVAVWPAGFEPPLLWPALLAVATLAWIQALTWLPYPVRGMRVIVALVLLVVLDATVVLALDRQASELVMLVLLAPHPPVAFLVARLAVARARRGDVPAWPDRWWRGERARTLAPRRAFRSPAAAQAWFEWRRFGLSLPALVGLVLPFELFMLYVFADVPSVVRATLLAVLVTPPFMASFVAATVGGAGTEDGDAYELTPFLGVRPLTSVALVAAKLETAVLSTFAAWALVAVAIPIGLALSGTAGIATNDVARLVAVLGPARGGTLAGIVALLLVLSTWKGLVQSLFIGVSGRAWLVKGSVFGTLSLTTLFVVLLPRLIRPDVVAEVLDLLPWLLAALVIGKMSAAAWLAVRLHASRLVSDRTLILGAACWDVGVLVLFALLLWLTPPLLFRVYGLALAAILAIPLVRVSAAPLALAWNRHR